MISRINIFKNDYNYPSFNGKRINITKEQIFHLRAIGKKESEIPKELGIATSTYYEKLKKLGIPSKIEALNDELSKITKDEFENLLKKKVPIDEICSIFNITNNAYYTLIERLGLRSYIIGANRKAVTKETLQELVDKQYSIDEICKKLRIGKYTYYDLVQKFDIKTTYKANKDRITNITRNDIVDLINNGKNYSEISQILGLSVSSIRNLITNFKIETNISKTKKITSKITKELLEALLNEGKKVSEICEQLNINSMQYTALVTKFNIMTKFKQGKANINRVTKNELQELVDKGFTPEEICSKLNIKKTGFYKLLKRLDIRYNYKNHANEIIVPKAKLEQMVKEWTSASDVERKLNITNTTFYEKAKQAKVKTILGDSIKKVNEINPSEIQKLLDQGVNWKDICKMYNLTPSNYHILIRKYHIISPAKKALKNSQNITKEQLQELISSGKKVKEICEILNISANTYSKKLHDFELK